MKVGCSGHSGLSPKCSFGEKSDSKGIKFQARQEVKCSGHSGVVKMWQLCYLHLQLSQVDSRQWVTSWGSSTNMYVNTRVLSQCLLLPAHTIRNENESTRISAHVLFWQRQSHEMGLCSGLVAGINSGLLSNSNFKLIFNC